MDRIGSKESASTDYGDLVLLRPRDSFVVENPHPFLVSVEALARPRGPQRTVGSSDYREIKKLLGQGPLLLRAEAPLALPVCKLTPAFASMITIGRTSNNDVVVNDVATSKFHAYIREVDGGWELVDAASSNGTFLGDRRLEPREPYPLAFGSSIRLGRLRFEFLDAGACWDRVRRERLGDHPDHAL